MGKGTTAVVTTPETQQATARMVQERDFVTRLFESALQGDWHTLQQLVVDYSREHNVAPIDILSQCKDGNKRTALHFACQSSNDENSLNDNNDIVTALLEWLPEKGAKELLRSKDKEGLTPLMIAVQNPSLAEKRVDSILMIGGDKMALARSKVGATALHYAAASNNSPFVIRRLYQAAKVALETASLQGGTPLHWAAAASPPIHHTANLEALIIDCGANIDACNEQGMTPLILALASLNDAHGKFLVQHGADLSVKLPGNTTVFHMAADLNLVGTLVSMMERTSHDYSISQQSNDEGDTPLDLAVQHGHVGCVMLLMANDGKVDEATAKAFIEERKPNGKKAAQEYTVPPPILDDDSKQCDPIQEQAIRIVKEASESTVAEWEKQFSLTLKQDGNDYFARNEYVMAISCYTSAMDNDPTNATFYSNRSACYLHIDQPEDALRDALVAQHLKPEWPKASFRVAVAQMKLADYESAALAAWEGLQHDTDNQELQQLFRECVSLGKEQHQQRQQQSKENEEHNDES